MKNFKFKNRLAALLILGLVLVSCSKDDDTTPDSTQTNNFNDVINSTEMDKDLEQLSDFVVDIMKAEKSKNVQMKSSLDQKQNAGCWTANATLTDLSGTITITFSSGGCTNPKTGQVYKGTIVINYQYVLSPSSYIFTYTLSNGFKVDDKTVSGSGTITDVLQNENQLPQRTHQINLTVTWPSGFTATREGTIIGIIKAGFATEDNKSDDVIELSGYWDDTINGTHVNEYKILSKLTYKGECSQFVSGSVEIHHYSGNHGVLAFGDDLCDGKAVLTLTNGKIYPIILQPEDL